MPLSSLGNINALGSAMMGAAGGPTPLDAIEARRAKRRAETIAQQEADAKLMKSTEDAKAGQAAREAEASLKAVLETAPKRPVGADTRSPEYVQWMRSVAQHTINSGVPEAMKLGVELMSRMKEAAETGSSGGSTMMETDLSSKTDLRADQGGQARAIAGAQTAYTEQFKGTSRVNQPKLSPEDLDAIDSAISLSYNKDKWFWQHVNAKERAVIINKVKVLMGSRIAAGKPITAEEAVEIVKSGGAGASTVVPPPPNVPGAVGIPNNEDPDGLF